MAWTPGQMLNGNKYTVEKQLGVGGFAVTYLAKKANNQRVVIKTLQEGLQRRTDFLKLQQDFVNEALKIKGCQHPNIVQVYELFQQENLWCIVLEYISGETLDEIVFKQGALPEEIALNYMLQIGNALEVLHRNNLLHRDIKPENIIIRSTNSEAVLIDFGIAREFRQNQPNNHTVYVSHGFAPFEQYSQQLQEGAYTDIYALTATLYVLLTGYKVENNKIGYYLPNANDRYIAIKQFKKDPLVPPKELNANLSDRVNKAIVKGMKLEAKDRPQSVQEWLIILIPPVAPTQPLSTPIPVNNLANPKILIVLSIVTTVLVGFVSWWLFIRNEPPYLLKFDFDTEKRDKKQNIVSYNKGKGIKIKDGKVCDNNGVGDIKSVKFSVIKKREGQTPTTQELGTVEQFTDDNNNCRLFNYEIQAEKLKDLTAGNYVLIAQAADKNQPPNIKELSDKKFKINAKPTVAYRSKGPIVFNLDDKVKVIIRGINVCDDNGFSDLADLSQFDIKPPGNLNKTDNLNKTETNEKCIFITYEPTDTLAAGDHELSLTAYDNSDEKSFNTSINFKINASPKITFSLNTTTYNEGEKLPLPVIRVCDENGKEDIKQVTLKGVNLSSSSQTNSEYLNLQQSSSSNSNCLLYTTEALNLSSSGEFELQITATDKNNRFDEEKTQFKVQARSPSSSPLPEDRN